MAKKAETAVEETKAEETKAEETKAEEMTEIFVPKDQTGKEANMFVSINGKNYLLPRGTSVKVPPAVAREVHRAQRAMKIADDNQAELQQIKQK